VMAAVHCQPIARFLRQSPWKKGRVELRNEEQRRQAEGRWEVGGGPNRDGESLVLDHGIVQWGVVVLIVLPQGSGHERRIPGVWQGGSRFRVVKAVDGWRAAHSVWICSLGDEVRNLHQVVVALRSNLKELRKCVETHKRKI
jgi:hypothetical protein